MSQYEKQPYVSVPECAPCDLGWQAVAERLKSAMQSKRVVAVDCYPGAFEETIAVELKERLGTELCVHTRDALKSPSAIQALVAPFNGGDDPLFGFLSPLQLEAFFDPQKLRELRHQVEQARGPVLIVGLGATLVHPGDLLVYADMARWEIQLRMRRGEAENIGGNGGVTGFSRLYKRAFFVDWRVADRHKQALLPRADFVLDTNSETPKLVRGSDVRRGLLEATTRPFRVVPFFDPAPWGGQWMRRVCELDKDPPNYGWCFDCVPEENSLLLGFGDERVEIPSINLVHAHPRELLGDRVHARFGTEFPIRFDFLDTMQGGHLSFQVHPLTEYIQTHFGMHYTQDESYYLLDAEPDACVYLGVKEGVQPNDMQAALEAAQRGEQDFPAERYTNRWPAKKHDHFLIPAGTAHCSGSGSMVLEISATPYLFTFKLWDWGRLGLDGKPRPINIERGLANIQFDRDTEWTRRELINRVEPLASGPGWREERTGLHEREFIETRRHWFTERVTHHTEGSVHVLNLVEGAEAVVESPDGAFEPFVVHYAETFIVPAAVGSYTIRPHGPSAGQECATIRASVRT